MSTRQETKAVSIDAFMFSTECDYSFHYLLVVPGARGAAQRPKCSMLIGDSSDIIWSENPGTESFHRYTYEGRNRRSYGF